MRQPHYWKKAGRTTAPSEIVVFDTEAWHGDEARVEGGELQTFRLACCISYRYEGGRRTRIKRLQTTERDEIWQFIESRLNWNRPVWLFGHNTPYDVGIAGLWRYLLSTRFGVSKCVLSATTTWIDGSYNGKRMVIADTANYLKMPLASIGRAVGLEKMTMPDQSASDDDWFEYCWNDVEITARAVDRLIDFVRHEDIGRWQPTAASMAFQALRKKFYPPRVLVHCDWDVLEMERAAYYGGICETAYVGKTNCGRVYETDVVSMYPSVCRNLLPVRLVDTVRGTSPRRLSASMSSRMAIADVTLSSWRETYPYRIKGRVIHAKGRFRTCLPHPELELALRRGHVESVHFAAFYEAEKIFDPYMNHFFKKRMEYRNSKNAAFAEFCKLLMTSLYGKCGQRSPRWIEWGPDAMREIEIDYGLNEGALSFWSNHPPPSEETEFAHVFNEYGICVQCRNYWGLVEVDCGYNESRDSCPAIAATVTSYARVLLRSYQAIAGPGRWFYSDTDSVWVDETGLEQLRGNGAIGSGIIGKLEVKSEHDWMIIHGPKDYETPKAIKLKGVKKNAVKGDKKMFRQMQFPSAMQQLKNPQPDGVMVKYIEKDVYRKIDTCIVGPDGWTTPLTIEE